MSAATDRQTAFDWLEPVEHKPQQPGSPTRITRQQPPQARWTQWLCIVCDQLPLETLPGHDPDLPTAVTQQEGQRNVIHAVSPAAAAAGIAPGFTRSAAQALCADLRLEPRDVAAETRRLDWLARWAGRFSSWICVARPDTVLLEVGSSQALFGGFEELRRGISAGLGAHGHRATLAIGCSARAAAWLARWAPGTTAADPDATRRAITALPIAALALPDAKHRRLIRTGVRTLGDLMRLPRDGVARRYGNRLLLELDEALGQRPETVPRFSPPEQFAVDADLPLPESATPRLHAAGMHLVEQLVRYLRGHDAAVDRLRVKLFHAHQGATTLTIGLASAGRDAARIGRLLGEQLDRTVLPEPVQALRLEAPRILPAVGQTDDLLDRSGHDDWLATVERWQARLGDDAVRGISARADHRPEQAWSAHAPGLDASCDTTPDAPRPAWLLPEPLALRTRDNQPLHHGPLTVVSGPERIEQGWWDDADISRDYYVVRDGRGNRLWIFQDRQRLGWWLHGHFA